MQVKMLLFPLSGTQQARSSSFPPWPREVCDFIYLATSGCILIKVNLKLWTTYHSISSTRNPTVHSISSTLNPTVLHSQGWVWPISTERVLQRTGYSLILTNTVLKATFKGLNEKVVLFLIFLVSRQSPAGFNFPLFPLFQLAPCSRAIATGFSRWTTASPPFWTQPWQLGAYIVFIIIEIEFSWLSDSVC